MILKAAYFSVIGLLETDPVTRAKHLRPAINSGRSKGIAWAGEGAGHNVRAWAELLVAERALSPTTAFSPPFGLEVQRRGRRIEELWRETLRYHRNLAYHYEVRQVREAAEWLLVNSNSL